jgi:hypothetical protein
MNPMRTMQRYVSKFAAAALLLAWFLTYPALTVRALAGLRAGIVFDENAGPPARYGIGKLEQALRAKGLAVIRANEGKPPRADLYVVARIGRALRNRSRSSARLTTGNRR